MNYWLLALATLNILLMTYIAFAHLSKNKMKAEDNRLTKGLQLLQNKISILQDLSDKTDEQVRKWVHLIEQKSHDVRGQLMQSDEKIMQIEEALSKALDVSKIFYEQVPHAEMAERQKTSKYVQAAKLAHQGFSPEQISQKVDLSIAEIEMISKMNREELQFSEEHLPAWVAQASTEGSSTDNRHKEVSEFGSRLSKMNSITNSTAFDMSAPDMSSMDQIKQEFNNTLALNSTQIPQTFLDEKKQTEMEMKTDSGKTVRPFEFKRITKN